MDMDATIPVTVERWYHQEVADIINAIRSDAFIKAHVIEWSKDPEDFHRLEADKYDNLLRDNGFWRMIVRYSGDRIGTMSYVHKEHRRNYL